MQTEVLLDRFPGALAPLGPLAAWAHGSLAGGDHQEGRSDPDLIAVLPGPVRLGTVRRVAVLHQGLRADPLAAKPHCSYLTPAQAYGAAPGESLPEVPDREPAEFVVSDQRDLWRPAVDRAHRWTRDVRVDMGPVTSARAAVTLREGRRVRRAELVRGRLGPAIDGLVAAYA
ncbi:nucleotidyltransferase [Streptomyces sp. NPDC051051]|uniref:nucleotidyltransferase n=1 Tax=Streptomyces sp. NPDC051051 TaxID=3155666 RepID=UPI0034128963